LRALLHGLVGGLAGAVLVIAGQVYGDRATTWVTQNMFEPAVGSNDGPLELTVRNDSPGPYAMTELRAGNDGRCFNDFLVTGSNYNDPGDGTLEANEASIVSESRCTRMHIKANSGCTWEDLRQPSIEGCGCPFHNRGLRPCRTCAKYGGLPLR
jgi:hypothetical protein